MKLFTTKPLIHQYTTELQGRY